MPLRLLPYRGCLLVAERRLDYAGSRRIQSSTPCACITSFAKTGMGEDERCAGRESRVEVAVVGH